MHDSIDPSLHALATECVTAALVMAYMKAVSRHPVVLIVWEKKKEEEKEKEQKQKCQCIEEIVHLRIYEYVHTIVSIFHAQVL